MSKAMMIATRPEWVNKIIDGSKTFEFRNYAIPKGTKVLVYESKGKRWPFNISCDSMMIDRTFLKMAQLDVNYMPYNRGTHFSQGSGQVVLEFVVGDIFEIGVADRPFYDKEKLRSWSKWEVLDDEYAKKMNWEKEGFFTWMPIEVEPLQRQGYDNQNYAHTITDLIVYDEEWQSEALSNLDYDWVEEPNMLKKIHNAPTEPQDVTSYVSWSKINKYVESQCGTSRTDCYMCDYNNECSIQIDANEDCKLTHPPQGRVWIYIGD